MSTNPDPLFSHEASVHIDAPPARVWELVTAMERYGEWSSENTGGYWRKVDGVVGTGQIGDQFVGINRRGDTEWKAMVEIVERDEQRAYAFITGGTKENWVFWRYQLEADPDGAGTTLTEHWELRNLSPILRDGGDEEVARRVANAHESIAATLANLKTAAEAG